MREYLVRPGDDVQAVFDRAEPGSLICFEAGIYRQKLMLRTPDLLLEGAGADETVLLWGDYAKKIHADGKEFNTFRTWTLAVCADGVQMKNLSVVNDALDPDVKGQEVALSVYGDRFYMEGCTLRSTQDTLFLGPLPQDLIVRYDGFLPRVLLDLYCGTGSIGIYCSDACHHLIGIESVESAVIDARNNARSNFIEDTEFIFGKAEEYDFGGMMPDAVVIDPPRKGCDEKLIQRLLELGPTRIVYVSCNPATLARDLQRFFQLQQEKGVKYGIKKICPVDMFPGTTHVETVVLLSKSNM